MQKLTDSHSSAHALRALRFAILRLGSRPETAGFAPDVLAARTALATANDALDTAQTARMAATAEMGWIDQGIDDTAVQLGLELRALVMGDTNDPRYKRLFPIAPSEATRPFGGDAQGRFVEVLLQHLDQDDDFATLRHHAEPLRELSVKLAHASTAREALYIEEARAEARRREALDNARRLYNLLYPRLLLTFPEQDGLVESFFWKS